MVRNPYFHVWSPAAQPDGYVDRIEWTFGVEPEAQIEAVAAGDADLAFDADMLRTGSRDLFVRFPAQVHTISDCRDVLRRARHRGRHLSITSTCDGR